MVPARCAILARFGYFVANLRTFWCFGVKSIVFGAYEYFWAGLGGDCCGGEVGVSSPHPLSSILPQPVPQLTCASYVISVRLKISKLDFYRTRVRSLAMLVTN